MKSAVDTSLLATIALACALAGCGAVPAVPDISAETQVLQALGKQWADAESRKDIDAALNMYWDDAVMLVPDQDPIEGREALAQAFKAFFELPFTSLEPGPIRISVAGSGEMAYTWANFHLTVPGPDGPTTVANKFIAVWKKRDGEWKIIANMSNASPNIQ